MSGPDSPFGTVNRRLANTVASLHLGIVAFFALGWSLPSSMVHVLVVIGGACLVVIWQVFDNRCPLTMLEARLRDGSSSGGRALTDGVAVDEPHFVSSLLERVLRRPVSRVVGDRVVYAVLFSSMFISALRLLHG